MMLVDGPFRWLPALLEVRSMGKASQRNVVQEGTYINSQPKRTD